MISGVSSKWFAEESIDSIENSVLSFVPEEYLSPLPRGAATAMIRRLGKTAGLIFTDSVADYIGETCADMPFWIRKASSYIHNRIDIGLRPFEPQYSLVADHVAEFVASDGTAMSEVALAHLFRVYPELRGSALRCASGRASDVDTRTLRTLEKYGIIGGGSSPVIKGQIMTTGLSSFQMGAGGQTSASQGPSPEERPDYGDWADELAIISKRRNVIEKKLRGIVANFLRFSSMSARDSISAKDRVLECIDAKRGADLGRFELDDIMNRLYWLELISVIKREWPLFEKIFGDRTALEKNTSVVNERPDAHAKDIDPVAISCHRTAMAWFEDRLSRVG